MTQRILLTGATSGIGLETAKALAADGHHLLVHGRSVTKLDELVAALRAESDAASIETYEADLSSVRAVLNLAASVAQDHERIDVVINNAGVFKTPNPRTADGLDIRFAVNTLAPFVLTRALAPLLSPSSRVVNLSSAAQRPVDIDALYGRHVLEDFDAYAQSKLALTMWSMQAGRDRADGPALIAVNPGSLLSTNMVKEGFGVPGKDVQIGVRILVRAALGADFAKASGRYFDNDAGAFAQPHPDAMSSEKCAALIAHLEAIAAAHGAAG